MYCSVLCIFMMVYSHHHLILEHPRTFSSPPPHKKPTSISSHCPLVSSPTPSPLWQPLIYFQSLDLPVQDISYKWNHAMYGPLGPASFPWYNVFKVHVSGFLFMAENIPSRYSTFLFILSSTNGHLGCFHLLAIMSNAMSIKYNFCVNMFSALLGIYLRVEFLGHTVCIFQTISILKTLEVKK